MATLTSALDFPPMDIMRISILVLALAAAPLTYADEVQSLLDKLKTEITATIEQLKREKKANSHYDTEWLHSEIEKITASLSRETFNADDAGRQLAMIGKSKASQEAKNIAVQLNALLPAAKAAFEKEYAERVDPVLKKAGQMCLDAKKAGDLDPVLAELKGLKLSGYHPDSTNVARIEAASRFIVRWQDYITQFSAGYDERAKGILRDMAENPMMHPLLTREQVMSKLGGEPKIVSLEKLLGSVKDLDELPKLIAEVGAVNSKRTSHDPGANETFTTLNELKQVYKAHALAKAGLYQNALQTATAIYDSSNGVISADAIRIKTMLLAEVLPKYLDLPEVAKPRDGENPNQFLLRIADEAAAKSEWEKVQRVLDTYRTSAFGVRAPWWLQGEITACSSYLSAEKLENAGDFRRAVMEYEKVLLQPGKRIPVKEATTRLAALKKQHPEDFDAASRTSETGDDSAKRPVSRQQ